MKIFKVISHPYIVTLLFSLILISGEQMGGFYLLYLLLGLPHGVLHSILGIAGIVLLIASSQMQFLKFHFIITGVILMFISLFLFFNNDIQHYNYETFHQVVPITTLVLFGVCAISCILFHGKDQTPTI